MNSLKLIELHEDRSITLDENVLKGILNRDEIKNRYVSVISVSGEYRQGKSFLMNFFLRYLKLKYVNQLNIQDWLSPEHGPLNGFSFAPGSKRHTTGIHMWPEVFCTELDGEQIAILVLDTQGAFDNQSTIDDCAKIFALSSLISSVQILNVFRVIKQYDLGHLQCFSGYGTQLSHSNTAPFQNLLILVRDWPFAFEQPYGAEGGSKHLNDIFATTNKEVKGQVDNVKNSFNEIYCFLMPRPGDIVESSPNFNGDLNDVDDQFKKYAQNLVENLVSPENIKLKDINGQKITASELGEFLKEYCNILNDGDTIPGLQTFYQTNADLQHKKSCEKASDFYNEKMNWHWNITDRCFKVDEFYAINDKYRAEAIGMYESAKKLRDEQLYNKYLLELEDNIHTKLKKYLNMNDTRMKREEEMKKLQEQQRQLEEMRRIKVKEQQRHLEEIRRIREQEQQCHLEEIRRIREQEQQRQLALQTSSTSGLSPSTMSTVANIITAVAGITFAGLKLYSSFSRDENSREKKTPSRQWNYTVEELSSDSD